MVPKFQKSVPLSPKILFRQINLEIFEFGTEIAPAGRHSTIRNLMRHPLPDARQQAKKIVFSFRGKENSHF